ncbi:hypothetical protein Golomagni_04413 [Golovinomyces magnicellulatus]|nr:hypothetical protein Golomagni_04413 [Golovinomyces magnicellulatus]
MMEEFFYGHHDLQKIALYQPPPKRDVPRPENALWLIYIHGGAWRDPSITELTFEQTVKTLLSSRWIDRIRGFASISYRLSSHPDYKQDPTTVTTKKRDAKHPDHIEDVLEALVFLQDNFRVGQRYILAGHSCGATLAFQTIMSQFAVPKFAKPRGIVGLAGIYNLRGLRDRKSDEVYQTFLTGAFGENEADWDSASPVNMVPTENPWPNGRLVILASSTMDEAVDAEQIDEMAKTLEGYDGLKIDTWKQILHCSHDEIWSGDGLAEVLERFLDVYFLK